MEEAIIIVSDGTGVRSDTAYSLSKGPEKRGRGRSGGALGGWARTHGESTGLRRASSDGLGQSSAQRYILSHEQNTSPS